MQWLISQDTRAGVWSGYSAHLPCGVESRPSACYLGKLPCKAIKQLVSGHLFARMHLMYLVVIIMSCTALNLLPWQMIPLGKGVWQGLLGYP